MVPDSFIPPVVPDVPAANRVTPGGDREGQRQRRRPRKKSPPKPVEPVAPDAEAGEDGDDDRHFVDYYA
jgi:hypothetical protein